MQQTYHQLIGLLRELIGITSFSGQEDRTADLMQDFLEHKLIPIKRKFNNVWAYNKFFDTNKPTILLNSHHDTVKPAQSYTNNPFSAEINDGKLYGLGSNDAGGALVSLLGVFLNYNEEQNLPWNLIYAATAEEEISGRNGIECILEDIGHIDLAIVGEPTKMHMAIAEKGLLVLDCHYKGISGHAGRGEGENAIYLAMKDLDWFRNFEFTKVSELLGPVKMNVTQINAGTNHNVTPDNCTFVVDIRCTDAYSLEEVLDIIKNNTTGEIIPRSIRLRPSGIDTDHPIITEAQKLGIPTYGSPTLSDQALLSFPSVKIGPGDSARSHIADEYIYLEEIEQGISLYIQLLEKLELPIINKVVDETLG